MKEFFEAIAESPFIALFVGWFIWAVVEKICDTVIAWRRKA